MRYRALKTEVGLEGLSSLHFKPVMLVYTVLCVCSCGGGGVRGVLGAVSRTETDDHLHSRGPVDRRTSRDTVCPLLHIR